MSIKVYCQTSFETLHRWPNAPEEVEFLKHPHRHVFHVKLTVPVGHDDRDIEFILLKHALQRHIGRMLDKTGTLEWSCERWAIYILELTFNNLSLPYGSTCEVSEDGENGAIVTLEGP